MQLRMYKWLEQATQWSTSLFLYCFNENIDFVILKLVAKCFSNKKLLCQSQGFYRDWIITVVKTYFLAWLL